MVSAWDSSFPSGMVFRTRLSSSGSSVVVKPVVIVDSLLVGGKGPDARYTTRSGNRATRQ